MLGRCTSTQASWIPAHQRPAPPRATGWDKASVLGRLLQLPRPPGPGTSRLSSAGPGEEVACLLGRERGRPRSCMERAGVWREVRVRWRLRVSGAACPGTAFPRVERVVYRGCGEVEAHVRDSRVHRWWCDAGLSVGDVSCGCTEVRRGMLCVGAVGCSDARVSGQSCLCDRCGMSPKCDESVPPPPSLRDR